MRRLGLLSCAWLLLVSACTRDNPAFDDCSSVDCVAAETGDGDGDPGDGDGAPGDGDGAPGDGDGDGAPGDGDGDGDGAPGDGDGDGDGDGAPGLPSCPNPDWVTIPLVEDTFLDASFPQQACTLDWDFVNGLPTLGEGLCSTLDFGGSLSHWVCGELGCNSAWLGRFAVDEWFVHTPEVFEAGLVFQAQFSEFEGSLAQAFALEEGINYGECGTWMAGEGEGSPPLPCVTTHFYAAYDTPWPLALDVNSGQLLPLGDTELAPVNELSEVQFVIPLEAMLVQDWLNNDLTHTGVVLRTHAPLLQNVYLHAQGSGQDPQLQVKLCVP